MPARRRRVAPRHSNLDRPLVFNAGMKRTFRDPPALAALLARAARPPPRRRSSRSARCERDASSRAARRARARSSRARRRSRSRVGGEREQFVAPADGRIVAWTITLGKPKQEADASSSRRTSAAPPRPASPCSSRATHYGRVLARSPLQTLTPYFGQTVQFPLDDVARRSTKGDVVALTVPTWAPALGLGLGRDSVWRASRDRDACDDTQTQSAQTDISDLTQYKCMYRTARLTYSATLITTPEPPKARRTPTPARSAAEEVEQRVDDLRVELRARRRRAARRPRPPARARGRYGRGVVIAAYASQARMMREPIGICVPARPSG